MIFKILIYLTFKYAYDYKTYFTFNYYSKLQNDSKENHQHFTNTFIEFHF